MLDLRGRRERKRNRRICLEEYEKGVELSRCAVQVAVKKILGFAVVLTVALLMTQHVCDTSYERILNYYLYK